MISVGIDISKDKHDCFIVSSEGEALADVFTVPNNMDRFLCLMQQIDARTITSIPMRASNSAQIQHTPTKSYSH